ncbi:Membrane bound O-acyl transferase, MBOAT [Cinara cedri]|uniref:Protein-serine O-palmitoleoyltransferase porcupine n=1 Tax=Cinara cedri TaxID=506608 RepID=A0A5E4NCW6_9HEMI|nr:Membrane bound O-acyl transferase, MBOAT [Cinara cedri]
MDQQQLSLSYGGNEYTEDYFYNSPADYYDLYDDAIDGQNQDEQSFWSHLSFYQLCTQCVLPAIWSTCNLLGTTLILCIFFRLFVVVGNKIRSIPKAVFHIVCTICGVLPIILFYEDGDLFQLLLQIVIFPMFCYTLSIICLLTLKQYTSIIFSTVILLTLLYRECFSDDTKWRKTKSCHMLMSLKAMAVLFDLRSNELHKFPPVYQYTGYMLCAGTIYLGPFLTFQEYKNALFTPVYWNTSKVFNVIRKIIISLFCFVMSICLLDWLLNKHMYIDENRNTITNIFLLMYKQALEFRTGHYFISYMSTVFAMVCGYNTEILVTLPMAIEWPQSLLNVVIYWNVPMHHWLKKYIFEEVLKYGKKNKHTNKILAVGATYLVSSLLHGLEVRLSAVLLSLALYTYVEHRLRTKLASKFLKTYSYYSKNYHNSKKYISTNNCTWFIWIINLIFTILNIIHLAYLGSVMDVSVVNSVRSYYDSFEPWRRVSYFSHFIILFMYLISIIL